jgi:[protein]-arginine 3-hydroxylase / protease
MVESSPLADARVPAPPLSVTEIERVPAPPPDVFVREYLRPRRPVVLTGLTDGWLPAAAWTFARMAERFGDAAVTAARLENRTLFDDPHEGVVFRKVVLRDFVAAQQGGAPASDYVMAPLGNFPPALQQDFRLPDYCAGAASLQVKVWLGQAGTVTPLHRDVPHNLNVHLTGRKRWLLFAPAESRRLYPRGLFSGMPNFAAVDPEEPDLERHPRFAGAHATCATVAGGETLFIPHGWWHHTRSLDDAVAMNFWWGGRIVRLASLASTGFKRLRGIRRGEW